MVTPFCTARPMRSVVLAVILALVLSACSGWRESRLNPMRWFGRATPEATLGPIKGEADHRLLVPEVTALVVEPTTTGALVRAEARVPTMGWWDAALVAENAGLPLEGVLTYRFVAAPPRGPAARQVGPGLLVAAAHLSIADLELVREIVVRGSQTSLRTRR